MVIWHLISYAWILHCKPTLMHKTLTFQKVWESQWMQESYLQLQVQFFIFPDGFVLLLKLFPTCSRLQWYLNQPIWIGSLIRHRLLACLKALSFCSSWVCVFVSISTPKPKASRFFTRPLSSSNLSARLSRSFDKRRFDADYAMVGSFSSSFMMR